MLMLKRIFKNGLLLLGLFSAPFCLAATPTIGDLAERMIAGTDVVTRLMMAVCIAVGIGFMILSVSMYKTHRTNPKFVPLDRPVMYLILGVVVLAIPFLGQIFGPTGSVLDLKRNQIESLPRNIDAPLE